MARYCGATRYYLREIMMNRLDQVVTLRRKVDALQKQAHEAKGEVRVLKRELREKWGCTSLAELKTKLTGMIADKEGLEEKFDKELREFQSQWSEELKSVK